MNRERARNPYGQHGPLAYATLRRRPWWRALLVKALVLIGMLAATVTMAIIVGVGAMAAGLHNQAAQNIIERSVVVVGVVIALWMDIRA